MEGLISADRELLGGITFGARDLFGAAARDGLGRSLVAYAPQHSLKQLQAESILIRLSLDQDRFEGEAFRARIRIKADPG